MADQLPVFPKVTTLEVHTGNIVNWNRLKRKPNSSPTDELAECIITTVQKHLAACDKTELQYVTDLHCVDQELQQPLLPEERDELKVTVKLFICSQQPPEVVSEAVHKVMSDLDVSYLETVLLSLSMFENEEDILVEHLKPYWLELQDLVSKEIVLSLGVSDLDKAKMEELYTWAKIKPSTDQVNLASCCVMPKDLTEYAKSVDIQLLTHNDSTEIMPAVRLQEAMQQCGTELDGNGWHTSWVARYSVLVKNRGIIKSKGYIMRARRDSRQHP